MSEEIPVELLPFPGELAPLILPLDNSLDPVVLVASSQEIPVAVYPFPGDLTTVILPLVEELNPVLLLPVVTGAPGITGPQGPVGPAGVGASHFAWFKATIPSTGDQTFALSPVTNGLYTALLVNGLEQDPDEYTIAIDGSSVTVPAALIWAGANILFRYTY